jgi:hypothetical protein
MTLTYEAKARPLRRAAKQAGYSVRKQRGVDWWRLEALRPATMYRALEATLSIALASIIFDAAIPSATIH